jgi:MoaA/NifB/PqqE/SkfB family radical SAM enzyme
VKLDELSTSQWRGVIDQLAELGCRRVGILGGEPLLRHDLQEIIAYVKEKHMTCVLTSNGLLVRERIQELTQLDTLVLSLDAAGPKNDAVRGSGSCAAVLEALAAAQSAGIPVKINSVLSWESDPDLEGLLAFCDKYDTYITFNIVRGGGSPATPGGMSSLDEHAAMRTMLARIARLSRSHPRIVFSRTSYAYAARWIDFSIDRYTKNELDPEDFLRTQAPQCHAGRFYMSILPDGNVAPCTVTIGGIHGGNVVREGVAEAWRSLHDHNCAVCSSICMLEQNYLLSLNPRVLSHFIRRHLPRFA